VRGLGGATLGSAIAGGGGGAAGAIAKGLFRKGAARVASQVIGSGVSGSLGGVVELRVCGRSLNARVVGDDAVISAAADQVASKLSPTRGRFPVRTVRGLFSGSPMSRQIWGSSYMGGLVTLGAALVNPTGGSCK
jgi:hypothetical protein